MFAGDVEYNKLKEALATLRDPPGDTVAIAQDEADAIR